MLKSMACLSALGWGWPGGAKNGFLDALVFALVGIVVVFVFGLLIGESPSNWPRGRKVFLGIDSLYHADGYDYHRRIRRRLHTRRLLGDPALAEVPKTAKRSHSLCGLFFYGNIVDLVGIQPDFQRPSGP